MLHQLFQGRKRSSLLASLLLIGTFTAATAQEFVNPLVIPPLISSSTTDYHLVALETQHNFNPMGSDSLNTLVRTFAFQDADNPGINTILGPTIAWQFSSFLEPRVSNQLDERTTCHWHGAHVPQSADGGPHQLIQPQETWEPAFEVKDKSATMWYHPHAMGLTYEHVQMGLSGMIYVEDPVGIDPILSSIHSFTPHDYGVNDFPLIVQTKKFRRDSLGQIEIQAVDGYKDDYTYLVNGSVDPVLETPANMIRLRLLNGDGKFAFNFSLTYDQEGTQIAPFQLIATDAGYTDASYQKDNILMAPGERNEFLVDLRGLQGDTLYLFNRVSEMPAGIIGNSALTNNYATDRALLRIVVNEDPTIPSPIIGFPIPLHPSEIPPLSAVSNTRFKVFRRDSFAGSNTPLYNIDSTLMDMTVVNDVVLLDSTEIWTIDNTTDRGHPWHIHDIHFWVTEVLDNGVPLNPVLYPEIFAGPKDNVMIRPNWTLSYITTFADYGTEILPTNSYMYHCHILPHEDRGMMGQFVVWNGEGDPPVDTKDHSIRQRDMKLFPNPSQSGELYLEGRSAEYSIIRIMDLQGRLVRALKLPPFDGTMQLEVAGINAGMVVIDWQSVEGRAVQRVVLR